jgi:hypothetical protein
LVVDAGEGTYDPATSTTTPSTTEYVIRLLAQDYIQRAGGIATAIGGLVMTGDKQFWIKPEDGVPLPRPGVDFIIYEGKRWTVTTVKDMNPSGGKSYVYEVYARL